MKLKFKRKICDYISPNSLNGCRGRCVAMRNLNFWLLVFMTGMNAQATLDFFYTPENIGNISGRVFADIQSSPHLLNMSVFGIGTYGEAITDWQVGTFSGVTSPNPFGLYQVGLYNNWIGSTAVQMTDTEMGGQLHTWSIINGSGYNYNLANLQVKYRWEESDNIRPWTRSTSKLRFAFNLKVPSAYMEDGAIGYVYVSLLMRDPNGKIFWIQPQIFDTRGAPSTEYIGWDAGTSSGFVNTYYDYGNNRRYCSKAPASYWSTGATWSDWRWYDFSVSRPQALNMINDLNAQYGSGLSTNLSQYQLLMFTIQDEIYWPTGDGHLGMGVRDVYLADEY